MMALIRQHLQAGKPLAASHGQSCLWRQALDEQHEGWPNFDVEVLGCHYENHYNDSAATRVAVSERSIIRVEWRADQ